MRKTLVTLLQIAITLFILGWLFRDPENNRRMWEAFTHADRFWLWIALVLFGMVEVAAVVRWQILLRVQGIAIGWGRLTALMMIGLFFNIFMPGGTGGDVAKIFYLLKETPGKKAAALLAVMVDRFVGLVGLIVIAAFVIYWRYDWLTQTPITSGLLFTLWALFGSALVFIAVSYSITRLGLVHKLPPRFPLRERLVEMSVAYNLYGRAWRSSLAALAISMATHFTLFIQFYFVAIAFRAAAVKVHFMDFISMMPMVNTLSAMPISIGGAGVREGLFVKLLGDLSQVDEATATIISLTGYMVIVLWGILGGVIYLFYRPSEPDRPQPTADPEAAGGLEGQPT